VRLNSCPSSNCRELSEFLSDDDFPREAVAPPPLSLAGRLVVTLCASKPGGPPLLSFALAETWKGLAAELDSDQALLQAMSELEPSSQPSEPYEALPLALKLRSWAA